MPVFSFPYLIELPFAVVTIVRRDTHTMAPNVSERQINQFNQQKQWLKQLINETANFTKRFSDKLDEIVLSDKFKFFLYGLCFKVDLYWNDMRDSG